MSTEIFVHGMSRVVVVAGMVRFELFTLAPPPAEGEPPVQVPVQAVIMPMEGFLRAFGAQENLIQQLIKAGALARREDAVPAAGAAASPNFA